MSEEDAISLSEGESEGDGPNIRPPQHAGAPAKHKHKKSKKSKDWNKHNRRDIEEKRPRGDRKKSVRSERDRRRDRDRPRMRDIDIRRERADEQDLRHRISRERYDRDNYRERYGGREIERHRYDRDRVEESAEKRERNVEHEERYNRIFRANKHMEESRKEVEARKKTKELEKEMERLQAVLKRKKAARRSRSRSKDRKKRKKRKDKSDSCDGSDEYMEVEEGNKGSESGEEVEEEEEEEEEGSDGSEEESGDDSDSDAQSDATTGSQKSEETPDHEESSEEGEVDDGDEDSKREETVEKSREEPPPKAAEPQTKSPPIEGKWADKSPDDITPSRSPTPLRNVSGNDSDRTPRRRERNDSPGSRSHSPSGSQHLESPPMSPVVKDELPPYFPSVHGCRNVEEFKCLNRIEEGTYGVVYRARDKRTNEIVALKRLKMEREKEGFPITSLREINTLLISQHPNVVTVREIVVGSNMDQIFIVMDYVHHDLKSLMETMRKKNQVFLCGEIKCLMIQLLRAISYLHDNWILHRDLKASNLLLSHNGILKVGDFGLAREYGSPLKSYTSVVVTLWYRAPELLLGIKEYSTFIDVWSIGCIFGELLLMEPLFPGKSEVDELNRIFKLLGTPSEKVWPGYKELPGVQKMKFVDYPISHLRDKFPDKMLSEQGLKMLKSLLEYDPKKRVVCETAMRAEYFREDPRPIDPSMFPTWPAKSEQEPGDKVKKVASPKPPSGGMAFKNMQDDEEDRARGFSLLDAVKNKPPAAGWNLKF